IGKPLPDIAWVPQDQGDNIRVEHNHYDFFRLVLGRSESRYWRPIFMSSSEIGSPAQAPRNSRHQGLSECSRRRRRVNCETCNSSASRRFSISAIVIVSPQDLPPYSLP